MLLETILLTIVLNSSIYLIKQMDWTEGYTCPTYCGVDHEHIGLDLESSLESEIIENDKSNKIRDLRPKKKSCNLNKKLVN